MSHITFHGEPVSTVAELPGVGTKAPGFTLVAQDLTELSKDELPAGSLLLNIFPSVDTGVCATALRKFNELAGGQDGATVVCVSRDLPFALSRFCAAEGIDGVVTASAFRSSFGDDYGVTVLDGPLKGLLSRAVVVIDPDGNVVYTEQVPEISQEPNYEAALEALRTAG